MNNKLQGSKDPDILASFNALRRAARRALELGLRTGTPVWVIRNGRMVDLTREHRTRTQQKKSYKECRKPGKGEL